MWTSEGRGWRGGVSPAAGARLPLRRQHKPFPLVMVTVHSTAARPCGSQRPRAPHCPAHPTLPVPLTRSRARMRSQGSVLRRPPPPAARNRRSTLSEKDTGNELRARAAPGKERKRNGERTSISQSFSARQRCATETLQLATEENSSHRRRCFFPAGSPSSRLTSCLASRLLSSPIGPAPEALSRSIDRPPLCSCARRPLCARVRRRCPVLRTNRSAGKRAPPEGVRRGCGAGDWPALRSKECVHAQSRQE